MLWNLSRDKTPERAVCLKHAPKWFDFAATAGNQHYFAQQSTTLGEETNNQAHFWTEVHTNLVLDFKLG